jgi:TonB family protein
VHVPLRSILDLLVVGIVLAAPASGAAQVFGGHIVDYRTRRPSGNLLVEALRTESVVATARTDSAGIFYLQVPAPGLYRLRIGGGTTAPFFTDTMRIASDGFRQGEYRMDSTATRVYYPFEIAKQVAPTPKSPAPRYPAALRDQHIEGEVLARFVVDTTGRAVDSTFLVMRATNPGFVDAVRETVRGAVFLPAELPNGRKVRQYAYVPFQFAINP